MSKYYIDIKDFSLAQQYIASLGVGMSSAQLSDFFNEDHIAKELSIKGFDTSVREKIFDAISKLCRERPSLCEKQIRRSGEIPSSF